MAMATYGQKCKGQLGMVGDAAILVAVCPRVGLQLRVAVEATPVLNFRSFHERPRAQRPVAGAQ